MAPNALKTSLNNQIKLEAAASMQYLAMAVWSDNKGYDGIARFFYHQAEEERQHMLKLIHFLTERGIKFDIPTVEHTKNDFDSVGDLFDFFLQSERNVTDHVNKVVYDSLQENDYTVHNFMQWYVSEQAEEEALAASLINKLKIIGEDKAGFYLFNKELENLEREE